MTQRTISLNEKAYVMLKKAKQKSESYSEIVIRLCKEKEKYMHDDIMLKLAGCFKDDAEEWKRIEASIARSRDAHMTSEVR
jgi:predicted CopG family antitoxin